VRGPVCLIARHELTLHRRNRWVVSFALLFAALTLLVSSFGMVTSGYSGFQDFVRTAASIMNLGGLVVPLFALLLGVFSFVSEREHLELLVTQPVSRTQVLLGKYLGLVASVVGATLLGFGVPGIVFSFVVGFEGALQYAAVVGLEVLLAVVFAGISVWIVLLAGRRQIALGVSIGVWFFFELIYGLMMLGTTLYLSHATLRVLLLVGLLGNPVDLTRVLSLLAVGGADLFGPAGATLVKTAGSAQAAAFAGLGALLLWVLVPLLASVRLFSRQNL